ncbi:MAG: hypothetical protein EP329_20080 [Deltaproteobacteria bacterium]|nr:MAG: hypothetical protein EP329_20080 [Deltaproteobacteria bacterium]
MDHAGVVAAGELLLRRFQLDGWSCVVRDPLPDEDGAMGLCDFDRQEIVVMAWLVDGGFEDDVVDTLTHETAHALARSADHGMMWQALYRILGGDPCASPSPGVAAAGIPWMTPPYLGCTACSWKYKGAYQGAAHQLQCPWCGAGVTRIEA